MMLRWHSFSISFVIFASFAMVNFLIILCPRTSQGAFFLLDFQLAPAGESSGRTWALSPISMFDSGTSLPPHSFCRCEEYSSRISDLESHLSLIKCQVQIALDKAGKSNDLMKQVSYLEDEVLSLVAKITHFEKCESFFIGIVKSVCEMLLCKSSGSLFLFCFCSGFAAC
jgi:hypothetical protein